MSAKKTLQRIKSSEDTDITKRGESADRFRILADSSPALLWVTDPDGNCTFLSKSWCDYTGQTEEEGRGLGWTKAVHPDEQEGAGKIFIEANAKREVFSFEYRLRKHDGSYRWALDVGKPYYAPNGDYLGMVGSVTDIHDRKLAEDELKTQELQFRTMAESIPQLAWMADETGWIVWYNQRWYDYTGTTFEEMEGWGWEKVHDPVELQRMSVTWRAAIASGRAWEDTFPLRRHDGKMRWFLTRAEPVRNDQGKIIKWFGTNTDINDQRELMAQLQLTMHAVEEAKQRFEVLTEAMPQLVWIDRGSDGSCIYMSQQWQDFTGVPLDQLLGYQWLEYLHPDDKERTAEAWQRSVTANEKYDVEYRIRRHDGEYRWFKVRGIPHMDDAGKVLHWYGTCTEIQDLVEAREKAEAANIAKSDFLATMSHEIRTPMNAVIGLSNILAMSSPLTPKQKEFIKTLQLSADSLLGLINDLLDIAKIEAHTVELEKIPFSIDTVMQEIVSMMSVRAAEKHLTFRYEGERMKNLVFLGDKTRVQQIVLNLCSNAIKFTENGGVTIHATHTDNPDQANVRDVCLIIEDTGIGIPPQKVETIFQKFVQADSSINRKYGGTGLGLAITKTLAEIMGGNIVVDSVVGKGSKFMVTLPLPVHADGEALAADQMPGPATLDTVIESRRPRVLLVEDYAPNVMVVTNYLEQFGYTYDVANNGLEAVEKAKTGDYFVILMDVQMHHMNGFVATKLIREFENENGKGPFYIIGMTAHALAGDKERCLSAGMDDYIAKPFSPLDLQDKLAALKPENYAK